MQLRANILQFITFCVIFIMAACSVVSRSSHSRKGSSVSTAQTEQVRNHAYDTVVLHTVVQPSAESRQTLIQDSLRRITQDSLRQTQQTTAPLAIVASDTLAPLAGDSTETVILSDTTTIVADSVRQDSTSAKPNVYRYRRI